MRRRRPCILVAMLLVALVVAGCGSGGMSQQWVTRTVRGQEVLIGQCRAIDSYGIPRPTPEECLSMRPVTITNNPSDEEFWQFKGRPKEMLWGGVPLYPVPIMLPIPIGRYRVRRDLNVIGSHETCEAVRATVTDPTTDPTESCTGPFYFHRDEK
jgi:hypothetical protein